MDKRNHSKLPWNVVHFSGSEVVISGRAENGDTEIVAKMVGTSGKQMANAAFIVKAVNAHDELVNAIQNCLLMLTKIAEEKNEDPNSWGTYRRLIDIVAKAEGK